MDDFIDSSGGYTKAFAKLVLADIQRYEKFLVQYFAWMYGWHLLHISPPVIIHNLYGVRAAITPNKANTPLIIYPNTVFTFPIAGKGL